METYIVTVLAKSGHEQQVADFYLSQADSLKAAPGFEGRSIFQARTGTMLAAVLAGMTPEERQKFEDRGHGHGDDQGDDQGEKEDKGTRFILIEKWATVDERMAFAKSGTSQRSADLLPHLLPEHTHEFYETIG